MLRLEAKFTKNGEKIELPMQLVELIVEWMPELTTALAKLFTQESVAHGQERLGANRHFVSHEGRYG